MARTEAKIIRLPVQIIQADLNRIEVTAQRAVPNAVPSAARQRCASEIFVIRIIERIAAVDGKPFLWANAQLQPAALRADFPACAAVDALKNSSAHIGEILSRPKLAFQSG